jgi:hypothetical protein
MKFENVIINIKNNLIYEGFLFFVAFIFCHAIVVILKLDYRNSLKLVK